LTAVSLSRIIATAANKASAEQNKGKTVVIVRDPAMIPSTMID
jgi:hypothetical protein